MTRKRGEGTYTQQDGGRWRWQASWTNPVTGKRERPEAWGDSLKDCRKAAIETQRRLARRRPSPADKMLLGAYLDRWLGNVELAVRPTTFARYESLMRCHVKPYAGHIPLAKLTVEHVKKLLVALREDGRSPDAIHKVYVCLHLALEAAADEDLVARNPVRKMAKRSRPRVHRVPAVPFAPEQVAGFFRTARGAGWRLVERAKDDRYVVESPDGSERRTVRLRQLEDYLGCRLFALYVMASSTGLREGELFGLPWRAVDLVRGTVSVSQQLNELGGKLWIGPVKATRYGQRKVDLEPHTVSALLAHKARQTITGYPAAEYVFTAPEGGWLRKSNFLKGYARLLVRAGVPHMTFHAWRHTVASNLLAAGTHPKLVQELLGHHDPSFTMRVYSHFMPGASREVASTMHGVMGQLLGVPAAHETPGETPETGDPGKAHEQGVSKNGHSLGTPGSQMQVGPSPRTRW